MGAPGRFVNAVYLVLVLTSYTPSYGLDFVPAKMQKAPAPKVLPKATPRGLASFLLNSNTYEQSYFWHRQNLRTQQLVKEHKSILEHIAHSASYCPRLEVLIKNPHYPLKNLGTLRFLEHCEHCRGCKNLSAIDFMAPLEPWLKPAARESLLHQYQEKVKSSHPKHLPYYILSTVHLLLQKSKKSTPQKVLDLAKELKASDPWHVPPLTALFKKSIALWPDFEPQDREEFLKRAELFSPPNTLPSDTKPPAAAKNPADLFKQAQSHMQKREFQKAVLVYNDILDLKNLGAKKHLNAISKKARAYKLMNKPALYLHTLEQAFKYAKTNWQKRPYPLHFNLLVRHGLKLAQRYWNVERNKEALAQLDNLLALHNRQQRKKRSKRHFKDRRHYIWYIKGRIKSEKGQLETAIGFYKKALDKKAISRTEKTQTLWHLAWAYGKVKKYKNASHTFAQILKSTKDPALKQKFLFWQGRNYLNWGKKQQASTVFIKCFQERSLSYYSFLAFEELQKLQHMVFMPQSVWASLGVRQNEPFVNELPEDFLWLVHAGEQQVAQMYLQSSKGLSMWEKSLAYSKLGKHYSALRYGWGVQLEVGQEQRYISQKRLRVFFPKPYLQSVQTAAQKFQVPEHLVYSLMRQESAFQEDARSFMDAMGLMQMLPRVAMSTLEDLQSTHATLRKLATNNLEQDPYQLFKPHISIMLGTAHLGQKLSEFSGNLVLAVASYNAGSESVKKWRELYLKDDVIEFIEDIPYLETRNYVQLILRNLVIYNLAYSPEKLAERLLPL